MKKTILIFPFITIMILSLTTKNTNENDVAEGKSNEIILALNLSKGKIFQMTVSVTSEIEIVTNKIDITESEMTAIANQKYVFTTHGTITYDYEVKDILPNGNYVIKTTVKKIKISQVVDGKSMEFDSETGQSSGMSQTMIDYFKKKIDGSSDTEIQKNGNVIGTTSMDLNFKNPIQEFFPIFSEDKINEGKSWQTEKRITMKGMTGEFESIVNADYKILTITGETAELSINGTYAPKIGITDKKISGNYTGTAKIDITSGITKELNVEQALSVAEINKNGVAIPIKMKNKIVIAIR